MEALDVFIIALVLVIFLLVVMVAVAVDWPIIIILALHPELDME
jgi:hypothetical protein